MTSTRTGRCRLTPSKKGVDMGLFDWLKRRKNRNTMHVTQVTRRTYEEMTRNTAPERNVHLQAATRRAQSTIRRVPEQSSPSSRSIGQTYNDAALWSPTYGSPGSSSSSGCSDSGSSGSSSSSSDSGSSGSCD